MISFEDIRQKLMTSMQAAHMASYPAMILNPPNFMFVDLENQEDPFVSVGIFFDSPRKLSVGESEQLVKGRLVPIFYFKDGGGSQGAYSYADMLVAYFAAKTIDGIEYMGAIDPIPVQTFPGWSGLMNTVRFEVTLSPAC